MYVECRESLSINQYLISRRQNILGEPKDPNGRQEEDTIFCHNMKKQPPNNNKRWNYKALEKSLGLIINIKIK